MTIMEKVLPLFLLLFLSVNCQIMPRSPCPSVFRYETDGYNWHGIIEATNPPAYGNEMTIKIRMAIRAKLPSSYVGKLELEEDRDIVLQRIVQNWPIKYKLSFPLVSPLPSIMSIVFNGRVICSGDPLYGRFITAIDLEHTLHSGQSAIRNTPRDQLVIGGHVPLKNLGFNNNKNNKKIQPDKGFEIDNRNLDLNEDDDLPISFDQKPLENENNFSYDEENICGTTGNVNPLIVSGEAAAKGDWPWMVAIFVKKPRGLEFICAGSLISNKHVLTAGHCMKRRSGKQVNANDIVLKLGVFNIQDWTEDTAITKSVNNIKVHDYFDVGMILNNDIAVLTMSQPVSFTEYIRPICLWSGDNDLEKIVGLSGTVVGWGKDEKGVPTTPTPKVASVPIVSTTTCRGSRPEFFKLTSDATICAGKKDGSGPCNGDSGGGMYVRQGSKWYIRGIVSKSLKDPETHGCDLNEYVVYTDAAKYLDFITS